MVDTVLKLGEFEFDNLEIPEAMPFGGDQRLVVHRLVGGARVVDAMGREDRNLDWSGIFLGPQALDRALFVDGMRVNGAPLALTWSEFRYTVAIARFDAVFARSYRIPYQISCLVVQDNTRPITSLAPVSHTDVVYSDNATAQALGQQINDPKTTGLLGALDRAIKTVSNFATAAQSTINSVLQPLAEVQARVKLLITTVGNTVTNVTTLGGILPNNRIAQNAAKLTQSAANFSQLPQLYNLQSVLNRMGGNINLASPVAPGTQTVTTAGGNLFDLAGQYYKDATQWTTLAVANKRTDPVLTGVNTITIPANPSTPSGGILGVS